jgi:diguanylate cyclase (GGDEF)-like protein
MNKAKPKPPFFSISSQINPILLLLLIMLVIGILDNATGPEVEFGALYLIPVLLAATVSKRLGLIFSLISATQALIIDIHVGLTYSHLFFYVWHFFVNFGVFVLTAVLRSDLITANQQERIIARTDALTGLTNMRSFHEQAEAEIYRATRYDHPLTLAYIDIDNFKTVNDTLGHEEGDNLLRVVAKRMLQDARKTDLVARIGGDEFVVLLPETDQAAAKIVINQIHRNLNEEASKHAWPVTFSIGVLTCTGTPPRVGEMIKAADNLMYAVKHRGKNAVNYSVNAS